VRQYGQIKRNEKNNLEKDTDCLYATAATRTYRFLSWLSLSVNIVIVIVNKNIDVGCDLRIPPVRTHRTGPSDRTLAIYQASLLRSNEQAPPLRYDKCFDKEYMFVQRAFSSLHYSARQVMAGLC